MIDTLSISSSLKRWDSSSIDSSTVLEQADLQSKGENYEKASYQKGDSVSSHIAPVERKISTEIFSNPDPILDQNMLFCCISRNTSSSLRLER